MDERTGEAVSRVHNIADARVEPSSHGQVVTRRGYSLAAALAITARAAGGAAALLGGLGLAGWGFDTPGFKSVLPQLATMKANTALALLLAGASLEGALSPAGSHWRRFGRGGAGLVALIGALTLGEYLLGTDLQIDELFFLDTATAPEAHPGRMAAGTALAVTLIGLALFSLDADARVPPAEVFAVAAGLLVLVALLGYLYDAEALYQVPFYGSMAPHTALALLLLVVGLLCARPNRGLMGAVTSPGLDGVILRQHLPAAVALPILLGWLRLLGQRAGLYGTEFGLALFALSNVLVFTVLGWRSAQAIARMDRARRAAEEHFRLLVTGMGDYAIAFLDPAGHVMSWNAGAEHMKGYAAEEVIGRHFSLFYPSEDRERGKPQQALATALAQGSHEEEAWRVRKDGSRFWAGVFITALRDEAGELRGYGKIVRDLTQRRRLEERFREVVEAAPNGIMAVDRQGLITCVNREAEVLFDYTREELLGQPVDILVPMQVRQAHAGYRAEFFERPATRAMGKGRDLFGMRKDGTEFPVEVGLSPIEGESGLEVLAVVVDITERKQAEAEVHRLNEVLERRVHERTAQLEATNQELEAFSYSVSHDLRAPLRHIHGFAALLRDHIESKLDDKGRRYLDKIAESSAQMGQLIDDLLAFSRMGRTEMHKARLSLERLVRDVIRELEGETQGREVIWDIGPLAEVWADPAMLRLVLLNLIDNALKYTRSRPVARIAVVASIGEGETVCSVRDNGVGFDMQYADKLFGVFQRLHAASEFTGTGIGLANVRRIISRHGGRTWAEGAVNAGACFYFSLPDQKDGTP